MKKYLWLPLLVLAIICVLVSKNNSRYKMARDELADIENKELYDVRGKENNEISVIDSADQEKILYTFICSKDGINIRKGPGTHYPLDETGQTMQGEKFYVLEEKDGWIRFRVTPRDIGWNGWVLEKLVKTTEKKQEIKSQTKQTQKSDHLQALYDSGLLKKFDVDYNEAYVNPIIWNELEYDTKLGIGIFLAKICDQKGSSGRITFLNSYTGDKLARYSQSWGWKNY